MQVADEMGWGDEDLVINIQGDEPMLPPQIVDDLFKAMVARAEYRDGDVVRTHYKQARFFGP